SCPLVIQPSFTRCKRGPECGRAAPRSKEPVEETDGGRFPRASPRRPTGQGATTCACPLRGVDRTRTYSPRDISHAPAGRLELEGIMMLWLQARAALNQLRPSTSTKKEHLPKKSRCVPPGVVARSKREAIA